MSHIYPDDMPPPGKTYLPGPPMPSIQEQLKPYAEAATTDTLGDRIKNFERERMRVQVMSFINEIADSLRLDQSMILEEPCSSCSDIRPFGTDCGRCHGAGFIPTAQGERVLELVRHNLRSMVREIGSECP